MSQSIILSGELDGHETNVRVMDQDFFPKEGDVVQIRHEPFFDGPTFEVRIEKIEDDDRYIMVAL